MQCGVGRTLQYVVCCASCILTVTDARDVKIARGVKSCREYTRLLLLLLMMMMMDAQTMTAVKCLRLSVSA